MRHSVAIRVVDWPAARAAATATAQAAAALGVRANVALVDAAGVLAGFLRSEQQDERIARAGLAAPGLN